MKTLKIALTSLHRIVEKMRKKKMLRKLRQVAQRTETNSDLLKLDLGTVETRHTGFVAIDLSSNAELRWDLRWGIPFDDNSVAEIRSDHFFEHLELSTVVKLLTECYRVLRPGALFEFTVPHIDPYLEAYQSRDFEFLQSKIFDVPKTTEKLYATCFDRIIWLLLRDGEHKSIFDRESIVHKVHLAGFKDVQTRVFDPSHDEGFRFSSIYVFARK